VEILDKIFAITWHNGPVKLLTYAFENKSFFKGSNKKMAVKK